ncbi:MULTISPECIES: hypothetical protein [Streptomyces]|uniref:Uncharacterized protein n=3 Tax=Streptomyces rimosus TaxID=1927 RepID=L8EYB0_STRR1|nr:MULTISPECIES: hypothetical protein [Streptomyces]KOG84165.1 hypothetical protein ADK78_00800 [Kitasatospora aureofaciens]MYT44918.1 hypothetical protein [Streptomyces sp. SID5471]KOT27947.1 hypothetical protein ADK84_37295 [Streptomyces sp. NRRL WC-3701]KOT42245.1 hypothetical protein ADK42_10060 [Streptomyces rimosus subsp. rimosus]KOT68543.1 hypothetical protein ADK44_00725 [Streptomyces rimosus subsp. rimosus]
MNAATAEQQLAAAVRELEDLLPHENLLAGQMLIARIVSVTEERATARPAEPGPLGALASMARHLDGALAHPEVWPPAGAGLRWVASQHLLDDHALVTLTARITDTGEAGELR